MGRIHHFPLRIIEQVFCLLKSTLAGTLAGDVGATGIKVPIHPQHGKFIAVFALNSGDIFVSVRTQFDRKGGQVQGIR